MIIFVGKRLFDELDRDRDGQVTLDDLEVAMKKRRLPQRYAKEFMRDSQALVCEIYRLERVSYADGTEGATNA